MKYYSLLLLIVFSIVLCSCISKSTQSNTTEPLSSVQEELISQGWCIETPEGGELSEKYGVKPIYGIQDNYFDIHIGIGFNVAIKIMNASTGKCIRYVYVPEGETVAVGQIPQGMYFLKLAYGRDWMEMQTDDGVIGKFTRGSFYEKSTSNYNFGEKNSSKFINYMLEINVVNGDTEHEFETIEITEEEFGMN